MAEKQGVSFCNILYTNTDTGSPRELLHAICKYILLKFSLAFLHVLCAEFDGELAQCMAFSLNVQSLTCLCMSVLLSHTQENLLGMQVTEMMLES